MDPIAKAREALTIKQAAFVERVFRGEPASRAYKAVGYAPKSDKVAESAASRLLGNVKVQAYLRALQAADTEESILSRKERLQGLSEVFRSHKDRMPAAAIGAIREMNRMTGEYRDDSVAVNDDISLFEAITGKRRPA